MFFQASSEGLIPIEKSENDDTFQPFTYKVTYMYMYNVQGDSFNSLFGQRLFWTCFRYPEVPTGFYAMPRLGVNCQAQVQVQVPGQVQKVQGLGTQDLGLG